MTRILWLTGIAGMLVAQLGCRNACERRPLFADHAHPKQTIVMPPPPQRVVQPIGAIQAPGDFPTLPTDPVKPPPSISKTPELRNEPPWQPKESSEPPANRDVPPRVQLYAPEAIEKGPDAAAKKPLLPPIAQFAVAKDNVYAGLRPKLDGLDWLKENRIDTIVHIRLETTDDAADRQEIEKRGMKYVAFEVSPQTLTKAKADEFIKLIRDHSKQGVFVYDSDGSLAGAMWYLHYRWGEFLADDASQLRTRHLGFQLQTDMWLAVQKLLSENNP